MTAPAEVIYFPKLCPHCRTPMLEVKHMSVGWLECRSETCPAREPARVVVVAGTWIEVDPVPFRFAVNRR